MKKSQWGALRRLLGMTLERRKLLGIGIVFLAVGTFFALLEPRFFGYVIDHVVIPKKWNLLNRFVVIYSLIHFFKFVFNAGNAYIFGKLGQEIMQSLRVRVFTRIQGLPLETFDRVPSGKLVTRVTYDIAALSEVFSAGFVTLIGNILVVFGILVWLLILNLKLGLIAVGVFPILIFGAVYFTRLLHQAYRETRKYLSRMNAYLSETLMGIKTVQLFSQEKSRQRRYEKLNEQYSRSQISTVRLYAFFQPMITVLGGVSMALVLWFGGDMAVEGSIKLGELAAFFAYASAIFLPIRDIADKWNVILSGAASAERIFDVLDWKTEVPARALLDPPRALQAVRGHIVFDGVWFAYSGEDWVFRDLSLEIHPGEKVGVVGHTGAGKSTLIALLMRFYDPQKGRILLDGRDLRDYPKRELRQALGLLQQDVFLFSGSIQENWSLWREPAPGVAVAIENMVEEMGLKSRLREEVQEKGSNLSSGEKQCIAFARAMAASPSVWILDEATSHVDSETESKIGAWLGRVIQNKTWITIAHRLATVKQADRIIVMNRGVIAEQGTHEQLLSLGGIYRRLYQCQELQRDFSESVSS